MEELANKFHADKGTARSSLATPGQYHNYVAVYERYMEPLRHSPISIMEIGLGVSGDAGFSTCAYGDNMEGGASYKMWLAYFTHPDSRVLGVDINSAPHLNRPPRGHTLVLDQNDPTKVDEFVTPLKALGKPLFNFIIDDGSHASYDQQMTLAKMWPLLKPGGVYFIEDLHVNPTEVNKAPGDDAPEELRVLVDKYGKNSNKLTERANDMRAVEVLERARSVGRLVSPYMSAQAAYLIEQQAASFAVERCGNNNTSLLGVIVKKAAAKL